MIKFRFLRSAEEELMHHIAYYAAIRPDLGVKFEAAVHAAVRMVVSYPTRGSPRSKNTRRRLVKGFPFGIVYRATEEEVVVVAVAHLRKSPGYWVGRR